MLFRERRLKQVLFHGFSPGDGPAARFAARAHVGVGIRVGLRLSYPLRAARHYYAATKTVTDGPPYCRDP
jgi:hypothetical protein